MMSWKRWLFSCMFLGLSTIVMTLVMTSFVGTMYTNEINNEFHISMPSWPQPILGVNGNVYKPKPVTGHDSSLPNEPDSVPTFSHISSEGANVNQQLLTPEKLAEIKQHLSPDDKMKIYSLITSKMPPDDIQKISSLLENGITTTNQSEIETILKQHLSEQEYAELTTIFSKY